MIARLVSLAPALAVLFALGASVTPARAVDGTWTGATTNEWTTGTNWSSIPLNTVPDNTATFTNNGAPTSVTISANGFPINTIQFDAGAPAYSFANNVIFNINGAGIVNNSAFAPSFTNISTLNFNNSSTAGNATFTNSANLQFFSTSTAGSATITNNLNLQFFDSSTAGNASITNNNGAIRFFNTNTAGSATITNNAGLVEFQSTSTAGNATITT